MRLGTVIGRVTLSQTVPALRGARWLVISPLSRDQFPPRATPPQGLSREPTLVIYDDLGGGLGDTVGFIEGREAAMPFKTSTPIDAINAAIVDEVNFHPMP